MKNLARSIAIACVCAALSGCLGPTPYQVRAYNGGYDDRTVSGERHFVAFYGNGFTSREAVLKYWLYRCAEVTSRNGFDYFVLLAKGAPQTGASIDRRADDVPDAVAVSGIESGETIQAKGVSGGGSRVPTTTYIPGGGGTTTRWSASGVIQMYKGEPLDQDPVTFVAKELLEKLGPEVRAGVIPGQGYKLPDPASATTADGGESSPPASGQAVKLDDLKDLLPE